MPAIRLLRQFAALLGALAVTVGGQAVAQTRISNTATLSYDGPTGPISVLSNTVTFDVQARKQPTTLSFRLLPSGYQLTGMKCETAPVRAFTPSPIDAFDLNRAPAAAASDSDDPLVIALTSPGGNRDATRRETAWITLSTQHLSEILYLLETGPDTGVFAGAFPAGGSDPSLAACDPTLERGAHIRLNFAEDDFSLASEYSMLIDPLGAVFDSETGALIDGASVTLVDEAGQLARVVGDDGVSAYPSTVVSGGEATDASGRVYNFGRGRYRFPLTAPGRYRLRIEPPARYSAPSSRSRATLDALRDPLGHPFILNDASFGGVFTLADPQPFIVDIPLDRAGDTQLLLTKTASVRDASLGDFIQYQVRVENRSNTAAAGVHLSDILPAGLRYERRSTRGAAEPKVSGDGRRLDFTVPVLAPRDAAEIRYTVTVAPGAPTGEAVNRVLASGPGGVTSNEAAASVRLRAPLFTDGFTILGRVSEGGCRDPESGRKGVANIRLLLEDGTYVVTDKDGLYHLEGVRPGRHVVQLDTFSLPATHEPVACDADTRTASSAVSRFVESGGGLIKRVDFQLRPTGRAAVMAQAPVASHAAGAAGDRDWFADQEPGIALLFPDVDHNPRAPTQRVVIKHRPGQRIALAINGTAVDPLAYDATDVRGDVAIARWTGVRLKEGENLLEARVTDASGGVVDTLRRTVHSASVPTAATVIPQASTLSADGLARPLIAVRLTDRAGRPVRDGTLLPFRVASPHAAALDPAGQPITAARVVGDDGVAYLPLQSTTRAGTVATTLTLGDQDTVRSVEVTAWLTSAARDWTVVGFGAGTLGHDMLRRRSIALPRGKRGGVMTDGQLAFYAKGRIKGSWLLTAAYDSDRKTDRTRGLLGTIDPDRYYTVYGDAAQQGYDAATARKLYLRLERREFYALFGDYETGLTATRLLRYSRSLTGAKAEYAGRSLTFTGFAAHTDELYARDEIQGNGLSGPYRLSGRDIVPNSDKLRIEVRDRLRPERIVSVTSMTRHIDYDIDPQAGTIRFRQPVLGRDPANNPIYIVVDYETYGRGRKLSAGGRAAVRLARGAVEIGASAIRDEAKGRGTLAGVDLRATLSATTELRAEAALGGSAGIDYGRAGLVELEHHGVAVDATVYAREQSAAYGLGQQNLVEAGTRKLGFDGRVRLDDRVTLSGAAWHQDQLDGPGRRTAGELRAEWRRAAGTLFVGGQFADDTGIDGHDRHSRLVTLGGTQALFGGKLTLYGQTQFAPGGERDSVDFPARHQLTAGYRIAEGLRLIGGYEVAQGRDQSTQTAQLGFDLAPWTGAKLTSAINQQAIGSVPSESAARTFAQYGLVQTLTLGGGWSLDATLDASTTLRGRNPAGGVVQPFQTGATSGLAGAYGNDGDYVAATLGAGYRQGNWSWNGRVELRRSDRSRRFGLTTNVLRALGAGQTLAGSVRYHTLADPDGAEATSLAADVALAVRPLDSRWSVLERLQLRSERADAGVGGGNVLGVAAGGGVAQRTVRAVNNLAVSYRTGFEGNGHGLEATLYHGVKWVRGSYDASDFSGVVQVAGFDLRQDLGRRVDIGMQGSVQHAVSRGALAFSGGPSAGVSPAPNLWVTAGFNVAGYRDRDFEDERYTRSGPYLTMRMKFDRGSLAGLLGRGR